jgi:hypothetical protein
MSDDYVTRDEWEATHPIPNVDNTAAYWEPGLEPVPNGQRAPKPTALEIKTLAEIAAELEAEAPVGWLLRPVWPADAYGVIGAADKAGKSLLELDLAVSVASGTPWLGLYPVDRRGPVLVFYGEGSRRRIMRRLRAIAEDRDVDLEALPIRLCARVPHLGSTEHLALVEQELTDHPAVAVIIDPLYLAARGAKGSDLFDMGAHLEAAQLICDRAGAALIVVAHFNKTGTGRGAQRITGVGPGAWGRVLITIHVEHRHTEPDTNATVAVLGLDFLGDEIPDTGARIRRRVWSDDPDDLESALHYAVDVVVDEPVDTEDTDGLTPSAQRVLAVLRANGGVREGETLTVRQIGDHLAKEGRPLKARTIQTALQALADMSLADGETSQGTAGTWWAL